MRKIRKCLQINLKSLSTLGILSGQLGIERKQAPQITEGSTLNSKSSNGKTEQGTRFGPKAKRLLREQYLIYFLT